MCVCVCCEPVSVPVSVSLYIFPCLSRSRPSQAIVHDNRPGKVLRSLLSHLQGTEYLLKEAGFSRALFTAG